MHTAPVEESASLNAQQGNGTGARFPTGVFRKRTGLPKVLSAITIFLSSILLFLIQPVIAKQLLPRFGGAAAVWATCMAFFQTILLLGYLYAHLLMRCVRPKYRILIHVALLLASTAVLWTAHANPAVRQFANPVTECLRTLALYIGLPYFVLSSTTPLVQSWYAGMTRGGLPYRLFALSNLGSLLALVSYPFGMERYLDSGAQMALWRGAYLVFAVLCGSVAIAARNSASGDRELPAGSFHLGLEWKRIPAWIVLPAASSALLLGVTNTLCQNIAPMPLLWIVPLALYLISFILCFDREGMFKPAPYRVLVPLALIGLIWTAGGAVQNIYAAAGASLAGLFIMCMFCHGQLSTLKPRAGHLTVFYLCISAGGAVGGLFAGLAAPVWFADLFELKIAIAACVLLALRFLFGYRAPVFLLVSGLALIVSFRLVTRVAEGAQTFRGRNFYAAISTRESTDGGAAVHMLVHGKVIHGGQLLDANKRGEPTFYYGRESGVALAMNRLVGHHRAGMVGLGVGTLAAYGRAGDDFRFYEINPMVADVARSKFTFLRDSAAHTEIVLGDARLSLEREGNRHFDTLVLDAFSGDSIPLHLLTEEAFQCYFRHLNADGVMAVHVSNQYLDLRPVVANLAARSGRTAVLIQSSANPDRRTLLAEWILVTSNQTFGEQLQQRASAEVIRPNGQRLWTDNFSNLLDVLR
jgi:spermidine synthase